MEKVKESMKQIVVFYHNRYSFPLRKTIEEHLYSFRNYSNVSTMYVNAAFPLPNYAFNIPSDLLIFHNSFLSDLRWSNVAYEKWVKPFEKLKYSPGIKAIIPQDEFLRSTDVNRFINDFYVKKIFSVSPESEWCKIFDGIYPSQADIYPVLTGYIDPKTLKLIEKLHQKNIDRPIDVSYRAWRAEYWLGKHGMFKTQVAEMFKKAGANSRLKIDISTRNEDTLLGIDWYKFLLSSKYTIGVEGGASLLDRDGSIRSKTGEFLKLHPRATFEETEEHCFNGLDGNLQLFALSPRHLEACLTKTCQILVEGEYNGVLKPWQHYIPLKKDFSNLEEVLHIVKEDKMRTEITERAYADISSNESLQYKHFVHFVIDHSLPSSGSVQAKPYLHFLNNLRECILLSYLACRAAAIFSLEKVHVKKIVKKILRRA